MHRPHAYADIQPAGTAVLPPWRQAQPAWQQFGLVPTEDWSQFTVLAPLVDSLRTARERRELLTVREARTFVEQHAVRESLLEPLSAERYRTLWRRFERFAAAHDQQRLAEVTDEVVEAFVMARNVTGTPPSPSTMSLRRSAVRFLFRLLVQFGLFDRDPTFGLELPGRQLTTTRPLTDQEVDRCRWASLATLTATRQPAVWGLAESGASTAEIGSVRADDVDFLAHTLWLGGGSKTTARRVPISSWAETQLRRRLDLVAPGAPLVYDGAGDGQSRRSSVTAVLTAIFRLAGMGGDPGVGPRSVASWLGQRVFVETRRIDFVAVRLGLQSLDLAAEIIRFDWSNGGGER